MSQNKIRTALTPPLGWNSWNCYGDTITQDNIATQAEAMVESGLRDHGFVYICIDDGWQGDRGGPYHAIQGNSKFPDIRELCDYVHSLGLKIGIYSTPWPKSYANYTGSHGHEVEDAKQWAEWGIDFLKYDWEMRNPKEPTLKYVRKMREALNAAGKEIVFSLSNNALISCGHICSKYANMWRTTKDIDDTWESISERFNQGGWEKFAGPGHWNDIDMMVLGYVGWSKQQHSTHLTQDEQITHMTLWCILSSPIILGCDLTRLDDFTMSILTNDEILAINQDPLGIQGSRIQKDGVIEIYTKPLQRERKAVGLFNRGKTTREVTIRWHDIGIYGDARIRDVWRHQDFGIASDGLSVRVKPHGAKMFTVG